MTLNEYLKAPGNTSVALASRLGVAHSTILRWAAGRVPSDRVADVARETGISAAELRPDLATAFAPSQPAPQAAA